MFDSEANSFVATQTASKQRRKKHAISLALELFAVRSSLEREALLNSQPISQAQAQVPDPLDAANPSGQIGSQQTGIGCLLGETPNGAPAQVDGSRTKQAGFQVIAIAENHCSVQSQSRFRTVPIDELVGRMAISALAVDTHQAVQHCCLGKFEKSAKRKRDLGCLGCFDGRDLCFIDLCPPRHGRSWLLFWVTARYAVIQPLPPLHPFRDRQPSVLRGAQFAAFFWGGECLLCRRGVSARIKGCRDERQRRNG